MLVGLLCFVFWFWGFFLFGFFFGSFLAMNICIEFKNLEILVYWTKEVQKICALKDYVTFSPLFLLKLVSIHYSVGLLS